MKQTPLTIIRHSNGYIEIFRSNGKRKVITEERYRILHTLKSTGLISGALLAAALFCGAALTSEHPAKWLQTVFLFGVSAFILAAAIVLSVTGGGEEKHKNNRNVSKRR